MFSRVSFCGAICGFLFLSEAFARLVASLQFFGDKFGFTTQGMSVKGAMSQLPFGSNHNVSFHTEHGMRLPGQGEQELF